MAALKKNSVAAKGGEPSYTQVTVVRTEEIDGHVYRRGERPHVDDETLAAMRERGMLLEDDAA